MALVNTTIQPMVNTIEKVSFNSLVAKKAGVISSILTPKATTIMAAIVCPANFTNGLMVTISSNTQKIDMTIVPKNIP